MSAGGSTIDAVFSADETDELGHLDYLVERLADLATRGLIADDARATVIAETEARRREIDLSSRYRAALLWSRELAAKDTPKAIELAERARDLDPARDEAWTQIIALYVQAGDIQKAIASCRSAAEHIPRFGEQLGALEAKAVERAAAETAKAEKAHRATQTKALLAQSHKALESGDHARAIAAGRQLLALCPHDVDALAVVAAAQERSGLLEEALATFTELRRLEPSQPNWSAWKKYVEKRLGLNRLTKTSPSVAPRVVGEAGGVNIHAAPPTFSWSMFAGEFLKAHAQELLLCLAVLLIVVSSTVGAHMLLGKQLWSPIGKCALAMIATGLFAALGGGLLKWGADRAGRMMLVATLIVVPIHFILVGEMQLLHQPTTGTIVFLAIEGAALLALVRWVSGLLAPPSGARFLTTSLLLLSAGSAATARTSPLAWELQFASFQLSPFVFLGAVWALGARRWGETRDQHREFVYMMLGLLGFALVACLVRTGGYALRLDASLYGMPVMLIGVACVRAARRLVDDEPDARRLALVRLGGYALSGLAFALALAGPWNPSPVSSGNTLAVAAVGLALYVASLRISRHPAFLYMALGAVVTGRLGAHYFLAERLHAIEEWVRLFLGYPGHLPIAFRAILGWMPNVALAGLALGFTRLWGDRRLARHCHYVGVPLSVAACVASGFEPLAAEICLSGYAILFVLAVWVFRAPWVSYLAASALTGACYFAMTRVVGVPLAGFSLAAALLGWAFWLAHAYLRRRQLDEAYHIPWRRAASVLLGGSMLLANLHLVDEGPRSWAAAGSFAAIAVLALIVNRERPRLAWAYLGLAASVEFTVCLLALAMGDRATAASHFGLLCLADACVILGLGGRLGRRGDTAAGTAKFTLSEAILPTSIILLALADSLAIVRYDQTWLVGLVFLLGTVPALYSTRQLRSQALVYTGLAQFAAGTLDLTSRAVGWNHPSTMTGSIAIAGGLLALLYWGSGELLRRRRDSGFYYEPCFRAAFASVVGVFVVALWARGLGRESYLLAAGALGLNVLVTVLLAWSWRRAELIYAAVFHLVTATYLVLFSVGNNDPAMAYVLGLFAAIEALAVWGIGFACQARRDDWIRACARPLYHWNVVLACAAALLSDRSLLVLSLVAVSFLLNVKSLPRAEWLYGTIAALLAAFYFRWLTEVSPIELVGWAMVAAFAISALAIVVQRQKAAICERLALPPLALESPLFHASIALAFVAGLARIGTTTNGSVAWNSHKWFPLALAVQTLVWLRAYPRRELLHASLALVAWTTTTAIVPAHPTLGHISLVAASTALGYVLIERLLRPHEPSICARLGIVDAGYLTVLRSWAVAAFGVGAVGTITVLIGEMGATMLGRFPAAPGLGIVEWWVVLAAIVAIGAFLVVIGGDVDGPSTLEPEHVALALHGAGVAVLWWLGVTSSPLAGMTMGPRVYYPVVTAIAALVTANVVRRHANHQSWDELLWMGDVRDEAVTRALAAQACVLSALALLFTGGALESATAVALFLTAVTMVLVLSATGWLGCAYAGSALWCAAWGVTALIVAPLLGWSTAGLRATCVSAGALGAAFSLLAMARWLSQSALAAKAATAWRSFGSQGAGQTIERSIEQVALASSIFAVLAALFAGVNGPEVGTLATAVGVLVILGAALLAILLVPRWQAEWLVYLAQTVALCAYLKYRLAVPQPIAFDAIVLTLIGYLNLGLAEVLETLEFKIYARPARFFSLVVPSLPLVQAVAAGGLNELGLFHLLSAGTFYGIACGRLRWKTLGYAAAVLYNGALWVLWGTFGWKLASEPQFFMVPVGLSTILFAEVNRSELGRANVNTIRTVGLTIIYLSMAVPIWQHEQNFGAWLALLIGSLVGIFAGIGLRLQTFLWMGIATFVLDVLYEMGRMSVDYAFAKWAIMLAIGIALVLFVALNEKKRIMGTMRLYFDQARMWD